MERKTKKTTRNIKVIFALLLLMVAGGLLSLVLDTVNNNKLLEIEILNVEKQILEVNNNIKTYEDEIVRLNERKEEISNVDVLIAQYKNDYFDYARSLEERINNGESDLKIAYLTFDDGPYRMSNKFLDVLDEYDVQATFFYLKKCAELGYRDEEIYDAVYQRVINSAHTLGNHTATHKLGKDGVYSSLERFMSDIEENRKFIYDRYGYTTDIMRFPGGSNTSNLTPQIKEELKKINYGWIDWNSETGDGRMVLSPEEYRDNVLNNTNDRKFLVVLMHDYSDNTLIALPEIIEGLQKQGYIFLPLFYDSIVVNK